MNYSVKVITDICDSFLAESWRKIDKENETFPQMTYEWCSTWWKYLNGGRKLHIVMLMDEAERAVAIAPLCIEKTFGISVLRSFPIQFGDFYEFIVSKTVDVKEVMDVFASYFKKNISWWWVRLELVSETNPIYNVLLSQDYKSFRVNGCVIINFNNMSWDDYLLKLKSKHRRNLKNRVRKLGNETVYNYVALRSEHDVKSYWDGLRQVYIERIGMDKSTRSEKYELALKESFMTQAKLESVVVFLIMINGDIAGFNYGFIKNNTYYLWQSSACVNYKEYHPSIVNMMNTIQWLIEERIDKVNWMAGDYNWKRDWSIDNDVENLYMVTSNPDSLPAKLLDLYFYTLRDRIKAFYRWLVSFNIMRYLKVIKEKSNINAKE